MAVKAINLSWITVKDFKKAIQYYTDVVGLKVDEISEEWGWAELSGHEGGAVLGIAAENEENPIKAGTNAVVTMTVESLETTCKELKGQGVELLGEVHEVPGHVKMQLCCDPDGNLFHIVEMIEE